jgi:hypothetical protein
MPEDCAAALTGISSFILRPVYCGDLIRGAVGIELADRESTYYLDAAQAICRTPALHINIAQYENN